MIISYMVLYLASLTQKYFLVDFSCQQFLVKLTVYYSYIIYGAFEFSATLNNVELNILTQARLYSGGRQISGGS